MPMDDYTPHQQRIIKNYYRNQEGLALQKLQELASDLYLAEDDKQRERLWKRVEKAMTQLNIPPKLAQNILSKRSLEVLIANLTEWWAGSLPRRDKR